MIWGKSAALVILSLALLTATVSGSEQGWTSFRGSPDNTASRDLDLTEGNISLKWEYSTGSEITTTIISYDDWVLFATSNGSVYKLDAGTGELDWRTEIGTYVSSTPLYLDAEKQVIVCDSIGRVTSLSIDDGIRLWTYDTASEKQIESSPNGEDMIYFGSYDSKLYALGTNGSLSFSYIGCQGWIFTTPAVEGGRIYFGSCDGLLRCLDAVTGKAYWNFSAAYIPSSPAVSQGRVYFGSYDSNMYCLDALTGDLIWNTTLGGDVHSSPAVGSDNGHVVVGCDDGALYCLDRNDGAIKWKLDLEPGPLETSPVIAGDSVIASYSQGIVIVDIDDGSIYRSFEYGDSSGVSPSINKGMILSGDKDGYVRALEISEDDDAFEIGVEDEPGRDIIFLFLGAFIISFVGAFIFFKRYRMIRERN